MSKRWHDSLHLANAFVFLVGMGLFGGNVRLRAAAMIIYMVGSVALFWWSPKASPFQSKVPSLRLR